MPPGGEAETWGEVAGMGLQEGGLASTYVAPKVRGENPPSRTRVEGPQPTLSPPPNCTPLPSRISRFATPNPFSSLISDLESDISDSESDDENETVSLPSHSLDESNLPVTSPQPFLGLLCANVRRPPASLPAPMSALSSVSVPCSSPLIADSGCTSILIQMANFPPPYLNSSPPSLYSKFPSLSQMATPLEKRGAIVRTSVRPRAYKVSAGQGRAQGTY